MKFSSFPRSADFRLQFTKNALWWRRATAIIVYLYSKRFSILSAIAVFYTRDSINKQRFCDFAFFKRGAKNKLPKERGHKIRALIRGKKKIYNVFG